MRQRARLTVFLSLAALGVACGKSTEPIEAAPVDGAAGAVAPVSATAAATATDVVGTFFGDPVLGLSDAERDRFDAKRRFAIRDQLR